MSNLEMWSLVVGFALPPALALVQQPHWPNRVRSLVAFAACAGAALGTVYVQGSFSTHRYLESALTVLVTAIATYHGSWKPTGIAPAIEAATVTVPKIVVPKP